MTLYLVKATYHTFPIDADNEGEAKDAYRICCELNNVQPDPFAKVCRATAMNYSALQNMAKRAEEAEEELASLRSRLSDIAEEG